MSALTAGGTGLVYRGPFTYRRSSAGALTLESAACEEGRLTPSGAMLHVTDHIGSVVAVVRGSDGALYEASDYDAYGKRSSLTSAGTVSMPNGITQRDSFTGKEDQGPDFAVGYTDFGARHYSPSLRRWLVPDPLSEKYYGISPYAYCAGDPVNRVDPDGNDVTLKFHKKYIEVSATIITNDKSKASVDQAISFWNNRSEDRYQGKPIVYNITTVVNDFQLLMYEANDHDGINTYVVDSRKVDERSNSSNATGTTIGNEQVVVKKEYSQTFYNSRNKSTTGAHEIGHVLGMHHAEQGIMSVSQDNNRTSQVTEQNIQDMMSAEQNKIKNDLSVLIKEVYDKIRNK